MNDLLGRLSSNVQLDLIRLPGAGRPPITDKYKSTVLDFVDQYTAGDPMSRKRWMRITLRTIADGIGNVLSHTSIGKILHSNNYSLKVNQKTKRSRNKHPNRVQQFDFIAKTINKHLALGNPVIGIDGKKTEKIGAFKQEGKTWVRQGQVYEVFDHDYSNLADGKLIPFGIYDYGRNEGYIVAGTNLETTEFAVDAVVLWWENHGSKIYPDKDEICITCDAGKPNSYRGYLFKYMIQTKFVDKFGITAHICHYTPGDSKYHRIERRLFSFISMNFRGNPLYTYAKAMDLIRSTTTRQGLTVEAILHDQKYQRGMGKSLTDVDCATIKLKVSEINPEFNYSILPRSKLYILNKRIDGEKEVIENQVWHFRNQPFKDKQQGKLEAEQLSKDNCLLYHEFVDVTIRDVKNKRLDGNVGRPSENTPTYEEYYFDIYYRISDAVSDYIEYLKDNEEYKT